MNANKTETASRWWDGLPWPRKLLVMHCLSASKSDHPAFHWNGETGAVWQINPDGTSNREMISPPLSDFRAVLQDLQEDWFLYEDREIIFEIPLESKTLKTQIRLEQHNGFPHLYGETIDCGDDAERDQSLKALMASFNGNLPSGSAKHTKIRGTVLDHNGDPFPGVRLADRKSNWNQQSMEQAKPGDCSQVVFSDENGNYELGVELTPGILKQDKVVVVYKSPTVNNWLKAEFDSADIEADPNDVTLRVPEPGTVNVTWDFDNTSFADHKQLQLCVFKEGYYHRVDIELTGELNLSGLAEDEYQIGVGTSDTQELLLKKSVEIHGNETMRVNLNPEDSHRTHLRLKIQRSAVHDNPQTGELSLEIYANPFPPFGSYFANWSSDFASLDFDANGVFETLIDVTSVWSRNVAFYLNRHLTQDNSDGWSDGHKITLVSESNDCERDDVVLNRTFDDGTAVEITLEESKFGLPEPEPDLSPKTTVSWWKGQSEKRKLFNRVLIANIRQGFDQATWNEHFFMAEFDCVEDYPINFHQHLGQSTFHFVMRELVQIGLTAERPVTLTVPMGEDSLDVNVSIQSVPHKTDWLKLSWQKVESADQLLSLKNLEDTFPDSSFFRFVRGRVIDHLGDPVAGAWVIREEDVRQTSISTPEEGWNPETSIGHCLTNANGEFDLLVVSRENRPSNKATVLLVQNASVVGAHFRLDDASENRDIEGVEIQLPKPAELIVKCDLPEADEVIAPLRLHVQSATQLASASRLIRANSETRFPNLTPGTWLVSIHQMGNDIARQVVDVNSSQSQTVLFDSTQKLKLVGELISSERPSEGSRFSIRLSSEHNSPFDSFRESQDSNFDYEESVILDANRFEAFGDQWKAVFEIRNLVGGPYDFEFSMNGPWEDSENGWRVSTTPSKKREIRIDGSPPDFTPIEMTCEFPEKTATGTTCKVKLRVYSG